MNPRMIFIWFMLTSLVVIGCAYALYSMGMPVEVLVLVKH
jgi:hypothetical protein